MQQLFGQKVLNDFIQKQDEKLIENRWQKYKNFLAKKEKISSWIETDYQDGFLEDIFENCLGYISKTRSTDEHYTLEREKKNETNAQKADGALLVDDKVVAVIELKDLKTKDLDKKYNREESAVRQAFGYLQYNNYAKYVIVSNFNELRFYFDKATAYEQFFLFDLDYEGFKKLHTILSYESISKNLPQDIKEKSLNFEQDISNKLYKDYTNFRTHLFENVLKNNQDIDKLELLNATQKLIDRIVFILFGEDTDLLPKNTIGTIIQRQKEVKKLVKTFTLYDSYKVYFEAINAGDEDLDITMYNGGLFAHDTFLDALVIDDEVLDARAKILSAYNFGSDISVNILGHIFENSISELEEISAQLLDNDFDRKQSKRKKDGVFYTPAYITEYIVQNTLGKLCEDKRTELNIIEVEAIANPKKPTKKEQEAKENLLAYKEWLLNLKILDPACGSGAFLNQALEYLLKEHKRLQNDLALMGDLFAVYEVEKEVLEHNLYGVDINEGAVEIARLSLWLRTAKRGRPLTKLANKIKVGNSLIDDKTVVPNAFEWQAEFPEVFAQGGFDVVIGNPPYGASVDETAKEYFKNKYEDVHMRTIDIFNYFISMSSKLLNPHAVLSFIIPNNILYQNEYEKSRKYLFDNMKFTQVINLGDDVFADASVPTCIIVLRNEKDENNFDFKYADLRNFKEKQKEIENISFDNYDKESILKVPSFSFGVKPIVVNLIEKIKSKSYLIDDIALEVASGISTGGDKVFRVSQEFIDENQLEDGILEKVLVGREINRYEINFTGHKLIYTTRDTKIELYPNVENYMRPFKDKLMTRSESKQGILPWSSLGRQRYKELFTEEKILLRQTADSVIATYDDNGYFSLNSILIFKIEPKFNLDYKFVTAILNSSLTTFIYKNYTGEEGRAFAEVKPKNIRKLYIPNVDNSVQETYSLKTDCMMKLTKKLQSAKQNFLNELNLEQLSTKLQNFEELTFEEFITEYTKALKLKFVDKLAERNFKQEWQALFENDKTLACGFKTEIEQTDKEIDKMVYELYGLTNEEIEIVEGN